MNSKEMGPLLSPLKKMMMLTSTRFSQKQIVLALNPLNQKELVPSFTCSNKRHASASIDILQ
jgi:hypothetical protein